MNQPDELKIIQIIPVTKPLLAVFRDDSPPNGINTTEIYAIELVENKEKFRYERGVIGNEGCFDDVDSISNFLGYAKDETEAVKLYGKEGD